MSLIWEGYRGRRGPHGGPGALGNPVSDPWGFIFLFPSMRYEYVDDFLVEPLITVISDLQQRDVLGNFTNY